MSPNFGVCLFLLAQLANLLFGCYVLVKSLRRLQACGRLKYSLAALVVLVVVLGHLFTAVVFAGMDGLIIAVPLAIWTAAGPFFLHLGRPERDIEALHVLGGTVVGFFFGLVCTGLSLGVSMLFSS